MGKLDMIDRPVVGTGKFYLSFDEIHEIAFHLVDTTACAAAIRIFCSLSYQRISYYSQPDSEPSFPVDDDVLARIAGLQKKEWFMVRDAVLSCFIVRSCRVWLKPNSFKLDTQKRHPLNSCTRSAVLERDGEICSYCNDIDGPFEIDHILPVSRGGSDDLDNLTVACQCCNRQKGDKLIEDWLNV